MRTTAVRSIPDLTIRPGSPSRIAASAGLVSLLDAVSEQCPRRRIGSHHQLAALAGMATKSPGDGLAQDAGRDQRVSRRGARTARRAARRHCPAARRAAPPGLSGRRSTPSAAFQNSARISSADNARPIRGTGNPVAAMSGTRMLPPSAPSMRASPTAPICRATSASRSRCGGRT